MNVISTIHGVGTLFVLVCSAVPLIASAALAAPPRLAADTILFNGKIMTVDKDFSIVQAVAIRDGKFLAVGDNKKVKVYAGPKTQMIDLKGQPVTPGFVDA